MVKKNLLLMYNARSGKGVAASKLSEIVETLRRAGYRVTVQPITISQGAEDILKDERQNFDVVVCCGGDGTLNHTLNGIMRSSSRPLLGYIPTGSTNDFAATLGIPGDVAQAREMLTEAQPFFYDVGRFRDNYFNYIAAFGAFTQVSYATPQEAKNNLGHAAYLVEALRHLPIGESHPLTATAGGKVYSGNYIYGSVSSSTSIGGIHFGDIADVRLDDGLFEVTLIKRPENILDLNSIMLSVITQNLDNNPFIEHFKTSKISFEFTEPVAWTLDGEYGGRWEKADITVLNKALSILR